MLGSERSANGRCLSTGHLPVGWPLRVPCRPVVDPKSDSPRDPYAPPEADVQRAMSVARAPGRSLAVMYGAAVVGDMLARATEYVAPYSARLIATWVSAGLSLGTTALAMAWL